MHKIKLIIAAVVILSLCLVACSKQEKNDQGRTSSCWIYAMCACIEHEALRVGDSIAISRQWLLARMLEEQALASEELCIRNVGPEALRLIDEYGIVPYSFERSSINNGDVLIRKIELLREQYNDVKRNRNNNEYRKRLNDLLPRFSVVREDYDDYDSPKTFYYYSVRYTPQQFAASVMYRIYYDWYAFSPEVKKGEEFVLPDADNNRRYKYQCITYQEMYDKACASLRAGHAVYWEYGKGHTSQHAMAIVEIDNGLVCLNSYGTSWGSEGYCTISKEFFLANTCNIAVVR